MELRFEPFEERHLDAYAAIMSDPDLQRFTLVPKGPPPEYPRQWFERYDRGRREGKNVAFAALDPADRSFLGVGMAFDVDPESGQAELGYVVGPAARGRGVATEILRRVTRWAFDEAGLFRAQLTISVDNPASKRVAAKCGYAYEGTLRMLYGGASKERSDGEVWSRLKTDPDPPVEA